MGFEAGLLFAFTALIAWGIGDFLIQRSTRKIGDWETLFTITIFGGLFLTPFVWRDIGAFMQSTGFWILTAATVVYMFASLLDFEALKQGKIAIVEPVLALEVPVTALLAFSIMKEQLSALEIWLIAFILFGIVLISLKDHHLSRKVWLEKGVFIAIFGALLMGTSNFMIGYSSRVVNPLLTIWFAHLLMGVFCFFYLMYKGSLGQLAKDMGQHKQLLFWLTMFDNLAWVAFAFASSLIPIAIVVALSESYIALAALLGLMVNKEHLLSHQKLGLGVALVAAIALAVMTG